MYLLVFSVQKCCITVLFIESFPYSPGDKLFEKTKDAQTITHYVLLPITERCVTEESSSRRNGLGTWVSCFQPLCIPNSQGKEL